LEIKQNNIFFIFSKLKKKNLKQTHSKV